MECRYHRPAAAKPLTPDLVPAMPPPYACHFCAARDAIVFCPVDAARLCLLCDAEIHGASTLAGFHPRTPLCDSCGAAPAALRFDAAAIVLCTECWADSRAPAAGTATATDYYTGCPGPTELVRLLSVEAPQPHDEFDAWLADMLHEEEGSTEIPLPSCVDATDGMCDVAIAAAKIERLLADLGSRSTDWNTSMIEDDSFHVHIIDPQASSSSCRATPSCQPQQQPLTDHLLLDGTNFCTNSEPIVSLHQQTAVGDLQDPMTATNKKKREERERAKQRYNDKKKNRR
jgi:hypothetical protein